MINSSGWPEAMAAGRAAEAGWRNRRNAARDPLIGRQDGQLSRLTCANSSVAALLLETRSPTNMLEFAATVFITFLVIIDPVGMLPLFVALTHRKRTSDGVAPRSDRLRRRQSRWSCWLSLDTQLFASRHRPARFPYCRWTLAALALG
jgi:hypothetical protein